MMKRRASMTRQPNYRRLKERVDMLEVEMGRVDMLAEDVELLRVQLKDWEAVSESFDELYEERKRLHADIREAKELAEKRNQAMRADLESLMQSHDALNETATAWMLDKKRIEATLAELLDWLSVERDERLDEGLRKLLNPGEEPPREGD